MIIVCKFTSFYNFSPKYWTNTIIVNLFNNFERQQLLNLFFNLVSRSWKGFVNYLKFSNIKDLKELRLRWFIFFGYFLAYSYFSCSYNVDSLHSLIISPVSVFSAQFLTFEPFNLYLKFFFLDKCKCVTLDIF